MFIKFLATFSFSFLISSGSKLMEKDSFFLGWEEILSFLFNLSKLNHKIFIIIVNLTNMLRNSTSHTGSSLVQMQVSLLLRSLQ